MKDFIKDIVYILRPQQWVKNTLVFAALIFANKLSDPQAWGWAVYAFFSFSFEARSMAAVCHRVIR